MIWLRFLYFMSNNTLDVVTVVSAAEKRRPKYEEMWTLFSSFSVLTPVYAKHFNLIHSSLSKSMLSDST